MGHCARIHPSLALPRLVSPRLASSRLASTHPHHVQPSSSPSTYLLQEIQSQNFPPFATTTTTTNQETGTPLGGAEGGGGGGRAGRRGGRRRSRCYRDNGGERNCKANSCPYCDTQHAFALPSCHLSSLLGQQHLGRRLNVQPPLPTDPEKFLSFLPPSRPTVPSLEVRRCIPLEEQINDCEDYIHLCGGSSWC